MSIIFYSVLVLVLTGVIAAVILFFVAKKFNVIEDPRIDVVCEILPGANCGGCGFAGCRALAEKIVNDNSLDNLFCPVGGKDIMQQVASYMNLEAEETQPKVAVVRCFGGKENTKQRVRYEGVRDCLYADMTFSSEGGCPNACLALGSCVKVCPFDAIRMDETTSLPKIDEDKCVACGICEKTCPRKVIEIRNKGIKNRKVFVGCVNKEKGALAKKNCEVSCIGCGKCQKACSFDAIVVENNLAYIDYNKCKLCRKCVNECPTGAIKEMNFPPKKENTQVEIKEIA
ncbi:MAG: RnfABCDGE type electron transport complex subunit B [Bacteroidales bacterium]|jgi:Na+-translocating ferredoxin:NAD+ oxidoreductase RNF subunit RnfB|nr:RnfABCDGE type electron transport complex subunit B [Bacteroidales bacterium]